MVTELDPIVREAVQYEARELGTTAVRSVPGRTAPVTSWRAPRSCCRARWGEPVAIAPRRRPMEHLVPWLWRSM